MNATPVPKQPSAANAKDGRPRILFVDDDPLILSSLRNAFRKKPYEILTAGSGEEALTIVEEHDVDVVVSDDQMPGMSGSELLRRIRRNSPETLRIILTGKASLEVAIRAINEGEVFRFLTKPCHPEDLAFTIQHGLEMRDLTRQSIRLLNRARRQKALLKELEKQYPGIGDVQVDDTGAILFNEQGSLDELIRELRRENAEA